VVTSILSAASNLSTRYDWGRAKTLPLLFRRSACTGQNPCGSALKTSDTSVFSQCGPSQTMRARQCLTRSRGRCRRSSLTAGDTWREIPRFSTAMDILYIVTISSGHGQFKLANVQICTFLKYCFTSRVCGSLPRNRSR
jgi:hypothetical protein